MEMKKPDAQTVAMLFCKAIEASGWRGSARELSELRYQLASRHLNKTVRSFLLVTPAELAQLYELAADPQSLAAMLHTPP